MKKLRKIDSISIRVDSRWTSVRARMVAISPAAELPDSGLLADAGYQGMKLPDFFALIADVGPVLATVITYVNPAVAVLLGAVFLHERIHASTLVGFALILAGSFLATRPARLGKENPELVTGVLTPEP